MSLQKRLSARVVPANGRTGRILKRRLAGPAPVAAVAGRKRLRLKRATVVANGGRQAPLRRRLNASANGARRIAA